MYYSNDFEQFLVIYATPILLLVLIALVCFCLIVLLKINKKAKCDEVNKAFTSNYYESIQREVKAITANLNAINERDLKKSDKWNG